MVQAEDEFFIELKHKPLTTFATVRCGQLLYFWCCRMTLSSYRYWILLPSCALQILSRQNCCASMSSTWLSMTRIMTSVTVYASCARSSCREKKQELCPSTQRRYFLPPNQLLCCPQSLKVFVFVFIFNAFDKHNWFVCLKTCL